MTDEFGPELRRRRMAASLSLREFALRTNYSKSHLSRLEAGERRPAPEFARRCDAILGAGGALAALAVKAPAAPEYDDDPEKEGLDEPWRLRMEPDGSVSFSAPTLTMTVYGDGAPAEALSRTFMSVRDLGRVAPPGAVLPVAATLAQTVRGCLGGAAGQDRRALLVLGARIAEFTGWMAQESGDDRCALRWTGWARSMAVAAGDDEFVAYVLIRRALLALYRGDPALTVGLSRQVLEGRGVPGRLRSMAARREAQGHALAGDLGPCRRALDLAGELDSSAPAGPLPLGPRVDAAAMLAAVTGWCLYDLGEAPAAAELLGNAVDAFPAADSRSRVRFQVRRALSHVDAGDLDAGCALMSGILPGVRAVDSATIRSDLRILRRQLMRHRTDPAARDLAARMVPALAGSPTGER